jgi:hypothetical protein
MFEENLAIIQKFEHLVCLIRQKVKKFWTTRFFKQKISPYTTFHIMKELTNYNVENT